MGANGGDAFRERARLDEQEFESKAPVGFFVNRFEVKGFLECDAASQGRCNEAEVAYEEYLALEDLLMGDPVEFGRERLRDWIPEIFRKGGSAHDGAIVKLNFIGQKRAAELALALQIRDGVEELRTSPRLFDAVGVGRSNHIGRGLLDHAEAIEFELTDQRGLAAAGRASQDKASQAEPVMVDFAEAQINGGPVQG